MDLSADDKLEYIEAIHGISGYAVYVKLLERIYRNGYYCRWTGREAAIFSKRINLDLKTTVAIVNDCINEELFDSNMYDRYQILTSRGIQRRYMLACEKRKVIQLVKKYLCIKAEDHLRSGQQSVYVSVNGDLGTLKLPLKYPETPQSKVKESKGKKSKEDTANLDSSKFIPLSLRFHSEQKKAGLYHKDFASELTEESKIVVSGAVTLEKLERLDGESTDDIERVLAFILNDAEFWKNQIVSLSSIRKKGNNDNTKYFNCKNATLMRREKRRERGKGRHPAPADMDDYADL